MIKINDYIFLPSENKYYRELVKSFSEKRSGKNTDFKRKLETFISKNDDLPDLVSDNEWDEIFDRWHKEFSQLSDYDDLACFLYAAGIRDFMNYMKNPFLYFDSNTILMQAEPYKKGKHIVI